jgi:hypothetical protein
MREVRIYHHVYTSVGGYKTVHASEGLGQDLIRQLEVFCNRVYPRVREKALDFLFRPVPSHLCVSRAFSGGSDHVGRPKSCVHSILADVSTLSSIPFFNPFTIPDTLFLTEAPDATKIAGLRAKLPRSYAAAEMTQQDVREIASSGEILAEPARSLFLSIFSSNSTVLTTNSHDHRRMIARIATLLPPGVRLNLAMACGSYVDFQKGAPTIYCLARAEAAQLAERGFVIIDLSSKSTRNLPAPNRYCQFIFQSVPENADRVVKLLRVLERYPVAGVQSSDMYHYLLRGYEAISHCFSEEGELSIGKGAHESLDNALQFYRAGYISVTIAILQQAFEILEKKRELSPSSGILKKVEESLQDPQVPLIQKEETITRLCAFLKRHF